MAADPSPTAAATRLVEPERRSPTANRPGQLVSYGSGSRRHRAPGVAQVRAIEGPVGEHEAVVVDGDAGQPLAVRLGTDEREQGRAVDVEGSVRPGEGEALQGRFAGEGGDGLADVDLHPGVGLDAVDEVLRHRLGQRPADDDADRRAALGEEHRRLTGRVAAADDDDRRAGACPGLELGRRVVHARHLVAVEVVDRQPAVVGAGGGDEGAAGDLRAVGQAWRRGGRRRRRSDCTPHGLVNTAPNFWAWIEARAARSWPEMPVGKPR